MKKITFVLLIGIITITGYAQANAQKETKTTNKIFRQEAKETKKLNKLQYSQKGSGLEFFRPHPFAPLANADLLCMPYIPLQAIDILFRLYYTYKSIY